MATGQPSTRLIMTLGGGRSEIHKQLLCIMINHHQNSFYSFSVNTYREISISLNSLYTRNLGGTSVEEVIPEQGFWNPITSSFGSLNQRRPTHLIHYTRYLSCCCCSSSHSTIVAYMDMEIGCKVLLAHGPVYLMEPTQLLHHPGRFECWQVCMLWHST